MVTLTLEVSDRLLRMTHRLIIIINNLLWTIVASVDKIPLKIRQLWTGHDIYPQIDNVDLKWASVTLTLEVGVSGLVVVHDTSNSSCYNKHLCNIISDSFYIISDSFDKWQSYGPDTKV
jgi:hypothetical protein